MDDIARRAEADESGFADEADLGLSSVKTRPDKPPAFRLEVLDGMADYDPPGWLIRDLLPARETGIVYGDPGSGKSFVMLDAALHVAAGRYWLGHRVEQAGVVYIAAEGGPSFRTRARAAMEQHGFAPEIPFGLITQIPELGKKKDEDVAALIASIVQQTVSWSVKPRLIVIDTLSRTIVGSDESSSVSMGIFIENVTAISKALEAMVVSIHHPGKDSDRGMRGSTALAAAADVVWKVSRDDDGTRSLFIEKSKEGQDGDVHPFRLDVVERGQDRHGDPITTCVVSWADTAGSETPVEDSPELSAQQAKVLSFIEALIDAEGVVLSKGFGVPAGTRGISSNLLRARVVDERLLSADAKSSKTQLTTNLKALQSAGHVRHDLSRNRIWLTEKVTA